MSFYALDCPKCGAHIQVDDEKAVGFCSYCGTQILLKDIIEIRHKGLSSLDLRKEAISEIQKMYEFFIEYENLYSRYEHDDFMLEHYLPSKSGNVCIGTAALLLFGAFVVGSSINIITGILLFVIALCVSYLSFSLKKKDKARYKQLDEKVNDDLKKLKAIYDKYPNPPLGFEYSNPHTISKIADFLRQGRADSIKDALNMYIQE